MTDTPVSGAAVTGAPVIDLHVHYYSTTRASTSNPAS